MSSESGDGALNRSEWWQGPFPAYLLAFAVFCLDQITKMIVEASMVAIGDRIEVIGFLDLFRLRYIHNPGAAWGILPGFQPLFIVVALVVSGICVWEIEQRFDHPVRYAWAFVLGGGLGNMVDRLFTDHGVVDFFDMGIGTYRWPTYNIADAALVVGMIWLGYQILFNPVYGARETEDAESVDEESD
jgi:signal peptidase II